MSFSESIKPSVLFLCTGNSARSQMAEALLRHKASEYFDVYSAGTNAEAIDERTISALEKIGLSTEGLSSKNYSIYQDREFDYVITLCDKASQECRSYSGAKVQLAWDFPDPKNRSEDNAFSVTLSEIGNRLAMFVLLETQQCSASAETESNETHPQAIEALTPIAFYKCLTDELRLKTLMLTAYYGEISVGELMVALVENSQPKVSRNLAVLKKAQLLTDRKCGQWVFYRINPQLPLWMKNVLSQTTESNIPMISEHIKRLAMMKSRPKKTR